MRLSGLLLCAITLIFAAKVSLALSNPTVPLHFYSTSDGLSQRLVQAFAQDDNGYLWFATWSGLNRFNGKSFDRLSVREGLRTNGTTALLVDDKGRLWVGDGGGGLSVIEYGRVRRKVAPNVAAMSPVRALRVVGDKLYLGYQSSGMGVLDLTEADGHIQRVDGAPTTLIRTIVPAISGALLLQSMHGGLHRYTPDSGFELLDADVTALKQGDDGTIMVGNKQGMVGRWSKGGVEWESIHYGAQILDIAVVDNHPLWVSTVTYIARYGDPDKRVPLNIPGRLMIDRDGVLWVISTRGLGRYLGERFDHFLLAQQGSPSLVFAIRKDSSGRHWFATSTGLIEVRADGTIIDASAAYGMSPCEVRDLVLAPDESALWLACFWNSSQRLDLRTLNASPVFDSTRHAVLALALDRKGWLWGGTSRGELLVEHSASGEVHDFSFGRSNPIYSLVVDGQQQLWVAVHNKGVYRLDTRLESAQPELVVSAQQLGFSSVMHLNVEAVEGHSDTLWMGGMGGRVLRWSDDTLAESLDLPMLSDQTIYAIETLEDNTLILGTERGLYRYDRTTKHLNYFGANDGFRGIETKNQAIFLEDSNTLWVGTGAGATRMDLRLAVHSASLPVPSIVAVTTGNGKVLPLDDLQAVTVKDNVSIEFVSVTTRQTIGVEYSHRLTDLSHHWSVPSEIAAVTFSSLPHGVFTFEVRARRSGEAWTEPSTLSITVSTPMWMTVWFRALIVLVLFVIIVCIVRLRTLRIELANRRLQDLVKKRTQAIEAKKQTLDQANRNLTREIQQRIAAEKVREEMEERFSNAYRNAPLGMALIDISGSVFDANPQLQEWFWPNMQADSKRPLIDIIKQESKAQFSEFLSKVGLAQDLYKGVEFECFRHDGALRRFQFFLSPIQDKGGNTLYGLLMAQDITESWELTRKLEHQASYDDLTGLYNRRSFRRVLDQACHDSGNGEYMSLIYMDLDGFKAVNDSCGHAAGDDVLRQVAELIRSCLRGSDVVARLGGDEFAAIIHNCDQHVAMLKAEDIRSGVEGLSFTWGETTLRIGVSIGLVAIDGQHTDVEKLLKRADEACYTAKHCGRNRVHLG